MGSDWPKAMVQNPLYGLWNKVCDGLLQEIKDGDIPDANRYAETSIFLPLTHQGGKSVKEHRFVPD